MTSVNQWSIVERIRRQVLSLAEDYLRFGEVVLLTRWDDIRAALLSLGSLQASHLSPQDRSEIVAAVRRVTFFDYCTNNMIAQHLQALFDRFEVAGNAVHGAV